MKNLYVSVLLATLLTTGTYTANSADLAPVILQEKDRGGTVNLQVGQKLLLYLRNPASGGYNTNHPIFNAVILELAAQKKLPPEARPRPGDFGQLYFEWQAKAGGETDIIINIFRPWEKKPAEEFWRLKVRVE